ncbi:hypothetical protein AB0B89_23345 [Sphaerisporangium sp. NPDC049002]|uniref:hypothetical protein n=1 Tax=unclassified Sphaerisporangium TaxID=2630420 RepID=UPI0034030857
MRTRRLTTVLTLLLAISTASPGVAGAESDAVTTLGQCNFGCSETWNQSQTSVYIARNWCWGDSAPKADNAIWNCKSDNVDQGFMWIYAGDNSPSGQDWDTFRVDAGWCYAVSMFTFPGPSQGDRIYDRRGLGGLWIKVSNNQRAVVTHQSQSSC